MRITAQIIDRIKKLKGFKSDTDTARALGMTRTALSSHKTRDSIPFSNLYAFCNTERISLDWLLTGEGSKYRETKKSIHTYNKEGESFEGFDLAPAKIPDVKDLQDNHIQIPYYDIGASAGGGSFVDSEQLVDYFVFKKHWIKVVMGLDPKRLVLISVVGDSMEPTLRAGDLIMVDLRENRVGEDAIYILRFDGLLIAKRLQRMLDGNIHIRSDNPAYKEQVVSKSATADIHIIGRAVWVGRRI